MNTPTTPNRQQLFAECKRIVVKMGSAVLTHERGLDLVTIHRLSDQFAELASRGCEVILVSSGAVAAGCRHIGLEQRPTSIPGKQAAAAIGQSLLMQAWEEGMRKHARHVAQILLTAEDLTERSRYLNARHTLETLLEWGVTPIINENDTVAVDEIKFGDNDQLAALIAGLVGADLVVLLTDTEGLYTSNPSRDPDALRIPMVEAIDQTIFSYVDSSASAVGTGGMRSKLLAAQTCTDAGIPMLIAAGKRREVLGSLFAGEDLGTLFVAKEAAVQGKKRWIAHLSRPVGQLRLDEGAVKALRDKGRSLLPVGIEEVFGTFDIGAPVSCISQGNELIGVGLTNYSSQELEVIKGAKSETIATKIGYKHSDEVIHRNHFVLAQKLGSLVHRQSTEGSNDDQG